MVRAKRVPYHPKVYQLSHQIRVPTEPSDGAFILGDRVRLVAFRRMGGRGSEGIVVAINLPVNRSDRDKPYQVRLEDCTGMLMRLGPDDLELVIESEKETV